MSSEKVNINSNGIQYSVHANRYDPEDQKYEVAWKIALSQPKNQKEYNSCYSLAKAKIAQSVLGCDYDKQTQQMILETFPLP
jgi:hypothetical protein